LAAPTSMTAKLSTSFEFVDCSLAEFMVAPG
jgi:hypothetical protein